MKGEFAASKGTVLFQPGQDCPGFLVLNSGVIRVTLTGLSGREVVLYRVRPGEVCLQTFACLIDNSPYSAEGVAEADIHGELVPVGAFRDRMERDRAFHNDVLQSVALRFGEYQQLVEEVALMGFDARLARVLLRLAEGRDQLAVTHAELAAETASGRAYVSRRLSKLATLGLVEQRGDGVLALDVAGLRHLSEE